MMVISFLMLECFSLTRKYIVDKPNFFRKITSKLLIYILKLNSISVHPLIFPVLKLSAILTSYSRNY